MAVTVSLSDVIESMEMQGDEHTAFINRRTGELVTISTEEFDLAEDPEEAAQAPGWQRELIEKARQINVTGEYLRLPSQFEIHEWEIMRRFADSWSVDAERDQLLNALLGSGAFLHFKDTAHRLGIIDQWYRLRNEALEEIAIEFLNANEIAYTREPQKR